MSVVKEWVLRIKEEEFERLSTNEQVSLVNRGLEARFYEEQEYNQRDYKKYKENQKRLFNEYQKQK